MLKGRMIRKPTAEQIDRLRANKMTSIYFLPKRQTYLVVPLSKESAKNEAPGGFERGACSVRCSDVCEGSVFVAAELLGVSEF
jgi:hypothetical protein